MTHIVFDSPLGQLHYTFEEGRVNQIQYCVTPKKSFEKLRKKDPVEFEFSCYFKDPNHRFSIPIHLTGTPFQKKVWRALMKIPVGKTKTYGELARELKSSAQAIGNACRANPLPILIPCHRIVSQSGLGGYNGATSGKMLEIKKWLLKHEAPK